MSKNKNTLGALAVGTGAILWGTIGPVFSLFPEGVSFQYSAFRSGVAVASVIAIGLAPIFVGIISWIIYKKQPGRSWLIGTVLGVSGITALDWPGSDTAINFAGIGFAALAAFAYSWQAIGMSELSKRHSPFRFRLLGLAPVAQWIEHQTSDLRVGGSSPSGRALFLAKNWAWPFNFVRELT
jgi:drug/metabolite transporter (DMT)-like permease